MSAGTGYTSYPQRGKATPTFPSNQDEQTNNKKGHEKPDEVYDHCQTVYFHFKIFPAFKSDKRH